MPETTETATTTEPTGQPTGEQQQGTETAYEPPKSQAELDKIIAARLARQKQQFGDYEQLKAAAAELDKIKQATQTAEQRQAEELQRWQTEADQWKTTAVSSRIEALAAQDFAYPSDAVSKLDPKRYLDAGGVVNEEAIRADLAALLAKRPNWARQSTTDTGPRPPAPNPAQGSSGAGSSSAADPAAQFAAILRQQTAGR